MKNYIIVILATSFFIVSCGQNGGNAVRVGSGTSPFPEVKANCNDTSCV